MTKHHELNWPLADQTSLPFTPRRFSLINWEARMDFKIAAQDGSATMESLCVAGDLELTFYRFHESIELPHPHEILVIEVTDGQSIVLSQ